ncbi:MAG: formylmethanofuran dehydrogenase [Methylocystis sp.]|nr:formylmethanofuran dehydrogenase [Methylocystis sp.]MBI3275120.1 formylmethanofuran dehydrogenase [Methylocystis sp.]
MTDASLDGRSIPREDAYAHAARILGAAHFPLVAGLGADVAGARAAILLAERLRGAFDHLASRDALADLDVLRSSSMFVTTPNEARLRSDFILLVGAGLSSYWPAMFDRLALHEPPRFGAQSRRRALWIGPKRGEAHIDGVDIDTIAAASHELPGVLAALRARVGGRPVALGDAATKKLDAHASAMKAAQFGVAVWAAENLDALTIEMLCGLVADLNAATRFTGVPIGARSGATGVVQASGWMTGFPPRTGFGRGYPEHDTWRFDARRLVDSNEADAALWISAYDGEPPPWRRADLPLVTLAAAGAKADGRGVFITVGCPGRDHDAVDFAQETSSLVLRKASAPSKLPSVADAIGAIGARFSEDVPC